MDFMKDMIDHHVMAVEMAEICVEEAIHPELERLCKDVISAQTSEVEIMQSWLQRWYSMTHEHQMMPADEQMMAELTSMSGTEFEIHFMEMMVEHHNAAIREAESCTTSAYHEELRSLCKDIILTQGAEIGQLQSWLCDWYGICEDEAQATSAATAPGIHDAHVMPEPENTTQAEHQPDEESRPEAAATNRQGPAASAVTPPQTGGAGLRNRSSNP